MANSSRAVSSIPFHVITVVWGPEFRQLFVDVCVPNQLSPGNLGSLPAGSRYRVFTSAEDAEFLETSAALRQVNHVVPVDVVVAPEVSTSEDQFVRLTACHARAVSDAATAGAAFMVLSPDIVMSEGTLAAAVRRHREGARAVVCAGLRVEKDGFIAALRARGGVCAIAPRDLVALALDHPHPYTRAQTIDSGQIATRPIGIYWNVPGEGILVRPFYLHPLMVDPPRRDVLPGETTIDHHYLVHACPARDEIHVVSDSDECVVFEMSHVDAARIDLADGPISPWRAANVLCRCDAHQKTYWRALIRLHARDLGVAWQSVEEESARFAARAVGLRLPALWLYRTSRRVRPLRRRIGAVRKRLRSLPKGRDRAARNVRQALRRARRGVMLITHSAARPIQKLRKRAVRAGRRLLQRVRLAH